MKAGTAIAPGPKCVGCRCSKDLCVFETHLGATCRHAACKACLRELVVGQLPLSRERWHLAVYCPEPGCQKRLPQHLVLQVKEARALANTIDTSSRWPCLNDEPQCPICDKSNAIFVNRACGHAACEACWLRDLESKLLWCREQLALDIPCVHAGCSEGCLEALSHFENPLVEEAKAYAQHKKQELQALPWAVHGPPGSAGPLCPVCDQRTLALMHCSCGVAACAACWATFAQDLEWCRENFAFSASQAWHSCRPECSCHQNLG